VLTLSSAAVVAAVALIVPLALKLARLPLPSIVVEIIAGIVIGPQLLAWAKVDEPVRVLSTIGLAFLLMLSGLEIEFDRLRGQVLKLTGLAFVASFGLALAVGYALHAGGLVRSPLLIAVILSATSLGVILPILKDAGQIETAFGQVVVAGASIAEVVPIVLLSLLFSEHASGIGAQLALLVIFLIFVAAIGFFIFGIERSRLISRVLVGLQDTTAQIRVRGAFALLMLFAALATKFGLEAILGAFLAGATLKLVDRDEHMTHTQLRSKLQAVGFGVFIPFFFISTGMALDVRSLEHLSILGRVPIFLAGLLLVRALPALFYRPLAQRRTQLAAAGLLQATSLSIPVVAGSIGVNLGLITPANYVALVAAGLLSVLVFPLLATMWLQTSPSPMEAAPV
jgi:Kef-type K+ transport system membrane component KefB